MKIFSNIPISSPQRWKDGEWLVAINNKDNGESAEEGKRYEADFTIIKGTDDQTVIETFKRMFHDPFLDQEVIDNIEIAGIKAIDIVKEYSQDLPTIKAAEVLYDDKLNKTEDKITSESLSADQVIEKVAGKIENYIIDMSDCLRTSQTDQLVDILQSDCNTLITAL